MEIQEKLVIIGSGPAGLTAAIYAARGSLNPVVISGREAGGQLMLTTDVDDFPGFPEGIQGPDLMARMKKQAERFSTKFIDEDVISVDLKRRPFEIKSETCNLLTETLIIATGASAMWLGLPSEQKLIGKGVSSCAVCDGYFFKDKDVIVVGGGDTAMREAQHLSKLCKSVTIVHRRDSLRAQSALQNLVKSKPNIKFIWNTEVIECLGDEKIKAVKLKDVKSGKIKEMPIDGLFVAIGHKPNVEFLKGQLELDKGYIKVKNETHASVDGVFVAGDVSDYHFRQAVTAAGAGCKATMDVEEYLEANV
ncbi:thioredoxin-disulfide reductase [Candidatus Daviesbacteria bacterium RIFCSPHIGHO2_12_FULL_37_11]|uniref:Thioredoxin reductase n=1 Tax=Candidatus Daviesbacteria bacterium RIFCSPHIGHO2_12_FULL_37_11 TaxID=1797777 RepID=A0A1F5K914_9BACT|nr:MAG: thioredoxin-disulfide reductase [Candidatus Daviesbacteria bacterium RIFCSPHIGHO2_01_FULL_37_27]OGE37290.1 MAG: thioredoxin-disulfide reductase [Candidatus Daviesbacteria bacterium RIFCSPHIGHO2_12_FULL_37_11]OGE46039.1 MAG: thioredoxin-disulfide reductase [Candidatus Daviesbacteria bacterium RIFCSPLOWO2_01_FULL_37_10]